MFRGVSFLLSEAATSDAELLLKSGPAYQKQLCLL